MRVLTWYSFSLAVLVVQNLAGTFGFTSTDYSLEVVQKKDLGSDLKTSDGIYLAAGSPHSKLADEAYFGLSRVDHKDPNDPNGPELIVYGTHGFDNVTNAPIKEVVSCEAYYNNVKCSRCAFCFKTSVNGDSSEPITTVTNYAYRFDCEDIVENRICAGVYTHGDEPDDLGNICTVPDEWEGVKTCFNDPPTMSPTSPTIGPTEGPTLSPNFVEEETIAGTRGVPTGSAQVSILGLGTWCSMLAMVVFIL